ncbi:GC-rich sequence DNA-binding factor [Blyttiomyces sp. JEL0837]|nr:GC-rich sequence DNA-binding factor [Blyttiomyces sp. JEL0837]
MFKAKKKAVRRPVISSRESDEDPTTTDHPQQQQQPAPPSSLDRPPKTSSSMRSTNRSQPSVKLGFEEDESEETESFKIKKTSASRRMQRGISDFAKTADSNAEAERASAVSYSQKDLQALAASQLRMPSSSISEAVTISVPDSSEIYLARKLREQRRQTQLAASNEDFISLECEDDDYDSFQEGQCPQRVESRLVTEDQEIEGEEVFEDYEGNRIAFGAKDAKALKESKQRSIRAGIDDLSVNDFEEDDAEWEKEQIKKVRGHQATYPPNSTTPKQLPIQTASRFKLQFISHFPAHTHTPALVPEMIPLLAVNTVCDNLAASLEIIRAGIKDDDKILSDSQSFVTNVDLQTDKLKDEMREASTRYNYFQELAIFVNSLADLLDVKIPILEKVEFEFMEICKSRRQHSDDMRDCVLDMLFSSFTDYRNAALDENDQRNKLTFAQRWIQDQWNNSVPLLEREFLFQGVGFVDDDEKKDELLSRKNGLVEDVAEGFQSLEDVLRVFEQWNRDYSTDFRRTYSILTLPEAISLHVRQAIACEDPFYKIDIESTEWHKLIRESSVGDATNGDTKAEERPLFLSSVEKIVLPYAAKMIPSVDLFSNMEIRELAKYLDQLQDYAGKESREWVILQKALSSHVETYILNLTQRYAILRATFVTSVTDEIHFKRNLWFAICFTLFKNLWVLVKFLPGEFVSALVVDTLLNRHLLVMLERTRVDVDIEKFEKIIAAFPSLYLSRNPKALAVFKQHLRNYVNAYPSNQAIQDRAIILMHQM